MSENWIKEKYPNEIYEATREAAAWTCGSSDPFTVISCV